MARFLGLGPESAYATPVAPTVFLEAESEQIRDEPVTEAIQTIRTRSVRANEILTASARGPATVLANYQDMANLFYYLLGDVDVTGAGPYTHTVPGSTGVADRPSLTVEVTRDGTGGAQSWRYAGMFLTQLQLSVAVDQVMRAQLGFLGKEEATGTAGTPSWPDLDLVLPRHCTMEIDSVSVPVRRFSINLQAPVSEPSVLGSERFGSTPADSAGMSVAGEAEVVFDDMVTYNKFAARTHVPVVLTCSTSGDEDMVLTMGDALLTAYTPQLDGRNQLVAPVTWASQFATTATDIIQAVVINDRADATV